jgi:hypothetical protein
MSSQGEPSEQERNKVDPDEPSTLEGIIGFLGLMAVTLWLAPTLLKELVEPHTSVGKVLVFGLPFGAFLLAWTAWKAWTLMSIAVRLGAGTVRGLASKRSLEGAAEGFSKAADGLKQVPGLFIFVLVPFLLSFVAAPVFVLVEQGKPFLSTTGGFVGMGLGYGLLLRWCAARRYLLILLEAA